MLSVEVKNSPQRRRGMLFGVSLMRRLRIWRLVTAVVPSPGLVLMTGMKIFAFGKVALAERRSLVRFCFKREEFPWSLSFKLKERMTLETSGVVGVLFRRRWAAWDKVAPGKQSTWTLMS